MTPVVELDLCGVRCPLPIVRLNNKIKEVSVGDSIGFVADDPAFPLDLQAWSRRTGHALASLETDGTRHRGCVTRCA